MTTPSERDQSLEQWLRQPGADRSAPTGACLDPETAAAWADGELAGAALEQAQLHLADCTRCQGMMATLLRTEVAAALAADAPPEAGWQGWFNWVVPAAAAATALIALFVWVGVRETTAPPVSSADSRTTAPADASAARADNAVDSVNAPAPAAAARASKTEPALTVEGRAAEAARAAQAPPASEQTPVMLAARSAAASVVIASPDPTVRWRIVSGAAERSADRGVTWVAINPGRAVVLLAGSAPSGTVCWIVGRAGTVLRTTDGDTWSVVAFPEMVDLTAVAASSAESASVTDADGRVFMTADGGRTWSAPR